MRLKGKTAFVTGASSGIGAVTAELFAQEGATVILSDINEERGAEVVGRIRSAGGIAEFIRLDVTSAEDWAAAEAKIDSEHSHLDVMVNNAGLGMMKGVEDLSLDDWRRIMSVNLDSVFLGTQAAIRLMKSSDSGSIINVSSIYGLVGEAMVPAYSASKGGVRLFTKSVALYCSERGYNIRCNSIHPGFVETRINENGLMEINEDDMKNVKGRIERGIAMGKPGTAMDIANGMLFLASDESKYMTGSELTIDGGFTTH